MSEKRPPVVVEDASLVGRIHAMLSDLHRQGRMSCAEVALIHALTQNRDLPDGFRMAYCGPFMRDPVHGSVDLMPSLDTAGIDTAIERVRELHGLINEAADACRGIGVRL